MAAEPDNSLTQDGHLDLLGQPRLQEPNSGQVRLGSSTQPLCGSEHVAQGAVDRQRAARLRDRARVAQRARQRAAGDGHEPRGRVGRRAAERAAGEDEQAGGEVEDGPGTVQRAVCAEADREKDGGSAHPQLSTDLSFWNALDKL